MYYYVLYYVMAKKIILKGVFISTYLILHMSEFEKCWS